MRRYSNLRKRVERAKQRREKPRVDLPEDSVGLCREILRFNPLPYQEKLLRDEADRVAVRFCRQSGKSTTLAAKGIVYAVQHSNSTVLVIAPGLRQSMILMDKVYEHLNRMDGEIKRALVASMRRTIIRLRNGSRIIALPCSENLVRGYSCHMVICDESSFFERDEYMFSNVLLPMLATTGGCLIVSSTPWSMKSMFYEYCKGKFRERFSQHYASWRDAVEAKLIDERFIEDMRFSLLPQQFQMEFEAEFTDDMDTWLPQDLIVRCIDNEAELLNENDILISC